MPYYEVRIGTTWDIEAENEVDARRLAELVVDGIEGISIAECLVIEVAANLDATIESVTEKEFSDVLD